jgi:hypothetical protein
MAKKTKLSRSSLPTQSREPAGNTPTAAIEQEVPLPISAIETAPEPAQQADKKPVGELSETAQEASATPAAAKPQPQQTNAVATPQRTSGAGWFIPPQRNSVFGTK